MTAVYVTIYRKILLICPEHIYRQRTNLMGLYSGGWGRGGAGGEGEGVLYSGGKILQFAIC